MAELCSGIASLPRNWSRLSRSAYIPEGRDHGRGGCSSTLNRGHEACLSLSSQSSSLLDWKKHRPCSLVHWSCRESHLRAEWMKFIVSMSLFTLICLLRRSFTHQTIPGKTRLKEVVFQQEEGGVRSSNVRQFVVVGNLRMAKAASQAKFIPAGWVSVCFIVRVASVQRRQTVVAWENWPQDDGQILGVGYVLKLCYGQSTGFLEELLIRPAGVDLLQLQRMYVVVSHPHSVHQQKKRVLVDSIVASLEAF